jgi:hypothetical protein
MTPPPAQQSSNVCIQEKSQSGGRHYRAANKPNGSKPHSPKSDKQLIRELTAKVRSLEKRLQDQNPGRRQGEVARRVERAPPSAAPSSFGRRSVTPGNMRPISTNSRSSNTTVCVTRSNQPACMDRTVSRMPNGPTPIAPLVIQEGDIVRAAHSFANAVRSAGVSFVGARVAPVQACDSSSTTPQVPEEAAPTMNRTRHNYAGCQKEQHTKTYDEHDTDPRVPTVSRDFLLKKGKPNLANRVKAKVDYALGREPKNPHVPRETIKQKHKPWWDMPFFTGDDDIVVPGVIDHYVEYLLYEFAFVERTTEVHAQMARCLRKHFRETDMTMYSTWEQYVILVRSCQIAAIVPDLERETGAILAAAGEGLATEHQNVHRLGKYRGKQLLALPIKNK